MEPLYDIGVRKYLDFTFAGNSGLAYLEAFTIFLILLVILWVFRKVILLQLKQIAKRTKTDWDDYAIQIIEHLHWPFYILISFYFSAQLLVLPDLLNRGVDVLLLLGILYY